MQTRKLKYLDFNLKGFEPVVLNPWESNSFFFRLPAWMLHLSCLEVCSFGRCFSISFYVSAGSPLAFCNRYFDDIFFHKTGGWGCTPARIYHKWTQISSLEINIFEINHISLICLEFFILKFTEPLQSYCCPVQINMPRKTELARQLSRYL